MENWIISRKQISLEKNKEFSFKIPVLINPSKCEFIVEKTNNVSDPEVSIVFQLRRTKIGAENEKEQMSLLVIDKITIVTFKEQNLQGEFLLLSCVANKNIQFSFSINRNFSRTII